MTINEILAAEVKVLRQQLEEFTALQRACDAALKRHEWFFIDDPDVHRGLKLIDGGGQMLAWISPRPGYCDRGHWQVGVECVPYLDEADEFPRYFMRLETAKQELVEFLAWRLFKERL